MSPPAVAHGAPRVAERSVAREDRGGWIPHLSPGRKEGSVTHDVSESLDRLPGLWTQTEEGGAVSPTQHFIWARACADAFHERSRLQTFVANRGPRRGHRISGPSGRHNPSAGIGGCARALRADRLRVFVDGGSLGADRPARPPTSAAAVSTRAGGVADRRRAGEVVLRARRAAHGAEQPLSLYHPRRQLGRARAAVQFRTALRFSSRATTRREAGRAGLRGAFARAGRARARCSTRHWPSRR